MVGQPLFKLLPGSKRSATVVIRTRKSRLAPDRFAERGNGFLRITLAQPSFALQVVIARRSRLEADRFARVGDGLVVLSPADVYLPTNAVDTRILGSQPRGFVRITQGDLVLSLVKPEQCPREIGEGVAGLFLDLCREAINGAYNRHDLRSRHNSRNAVALGLQLERRAFHRFDAIDVVFPATSQELTAIVADRTVALAQHHSIANADLAVGLLRRRARRGKNRPPAKECDGKTHTVRPTDRPHTGKDARHGRVLRLDRMPFLNPCGRLAGDHTPAAKAGQDKQPANPLMI